MDWILDNLQLVVVLASAFAVWLTQRRKQPPPEEGSPTSRPETDAGPIDLEAEARRIQDEIRRKIAQRRERPAEGPAPPPLPPAREMRPRTVLTVPAPPRPMPEWDQTETLVLENQRRMQEQMRELEAQRRSLRQPSQPAFTYPTMQIRPAAEGPARPAAGRAIRNALRNPVNVRQAVLLREVLGPPVALQRRG